MPVVQAAHRRLVSAPRLFRPVNVLDRSSATITLALSTTAFTARQVTVRTWVFPAASLPVFCDGAEVGAADPLRRAVPATPGGLVPD